MRFAFLILHYKNADVTINCIDSILNIMTERNYDIVIVDNASQNGSYEELTKRYAEDTNVHFLCNKENQGYARGNNTGFLYAKNSLKADWICLANNDLIFSESGWIDKILAVYERSKFYVMGPDIVTPQGEHQNPFRSSIANKKHVMKSIVHDIIVYILMALRLQQKIRKKMKIQNPRSDCDYQKTVDDFKGVLHGSCLIFSPDYIREFDGLYKGTFLYAEEDILCYILNTLGYRYIYNSAIQVTHCHATSFKRAVKDEDKRKMKVIKNRVRSNIKFYKIMTNTKDIGRYLMVED